MYLYFKHLDCVITCEEFPHAIPVQEMKAKNLQSLCDRWVKTDEANDTFTLSFLYQEDICRCHPNSYPRDLCYIRCPTCGKHFTSYFPEGTQVFLQNSGYQDHLCVRSTQSSDCLFQSVPDHPNLYQWTYPTEALAALHVLHHRILSDSPLDKNEDVDTAFLVFTDTV